jgi:hypothetical protein
LKNSFFPACMINIVHEKYEKTMNKKKHFMIFGKHFQGFNKTVCLVFSSVRAVL